MWNFPDQGANPCPLNWKHGVLATAPPSLTLIFSIQLYFEITGESYAVVRKNTAIPFTQLPQISYNITNKIWKMTQSRYSTVPSLLWADPLPPTLPLQFLPPATTNLLPVSMGLPLSDVLYKWNHTICDFNVCQPSGKVTCELIFQLIKMVKEVFSSHCEKLKRTKMSVVVYQFLKNVKI